MEVLSTPDMKLSEVECLYHKHKVSHPLLSFISAQLSLDEQCRR